MRELTTTVERDLAINAAIVRTLAKSPSLLKGDLAEFERLARAITTPSTWIVLTDKAGQQIVNSGVPAGAPLTNVVRPGTMSEALSTAFAGQEYTSNLFTGPLKNRHVLSFTVPVGQNGQVAYALSVAWDLTPMARAFLGLTSPGWISVFADRNGIIMARTSDPERWVGDRVSETTWQEFQSAQPGVTARWSGRVRTLENQQVIGSYHKLAGTGWYIGVSALPEIFQRPLRQALLLGGLLLLMFTGLPPLLAWLLGRRVTHALHALAVKAGALERGEVVDPPLTSLIEVNEAGLAMHRAAKRLKMEAEHQSLLLQELNHRVKNSLMSIQAIARRTFKGGDQDRYARFEGRILALSATHNLLTQTQWAGADLADLVSFELAPYRDQVQQGGEAVFLNSRTALSLSLVLHELATNAAKHGVLSVPEGKVQISWTTQREAEGTALHLTWAESRGPLVAPPTKRGFGTMLIQTSIRNELGGTVDMVFDADGLKCEIRVVLMKEMLMLEPSGFAA